MLTISWALNHNFSGQFGRDQRAISLHLFQDAPNGYS
jgi:hypothetical protein